MLTLLLDIVNYFMLDLVMFCLHFTDIELIIYYVYSKKKNFGGGPSKVKQFSPYNMKCMFTGLLQVSQC